MKFITIEGIDGAGKTTAAELVAAELRKRGLKVYVTAEHTRKVKRLNGILNKKIKASGDEIVRLFLIDRLFHIRKTLFKKRGRFDVIITDRYYLSNYAYNADDEASLSALRKLNKKAKRLMNPNAHFIIDVPAEVALTRLNRRGGAATLFENREKLERVRENYLNLAKNEKNEKIFVADGNLSKEKVAEFILKVVTEL